MTTAQFMSAGAGFGPSGLYVIISYRYVQTVRYQKLTS